jgi:putative aldouronate transport system permease protein
MGKMRKTSGERVFDIINCCVMALIIMITVYPFLHVTAVSLNEARDSAAGGIGILPRKFSFDSYITVFRYNNIVNAFLISAARTIIGALLTIFLNPYSGSANSLCYKELR